MEMLHSPSRNLALAVAFVAFAVVVSACSSGTDQPSNASTSNGSSSDVAQVQWDGIDSLRYNEVQFIGSHNSYKLKPREEVASALGALAPELFLQIDYEHLPLTEQLEDYGVRQFELDVYADPDGGLWAEPAAHTILSIDEEPLPELLEPGFKVLHTQDMDYATTCLTFVTCLEEIKAWSTANPSHLPVMVMVETKNDSLASGAEGLGIDLTQLGVEFNDPVRMTSDLFDDLETEILSVFDADHLLLPDDIRGDADSLEEVILETGWPVFGELRGKVMFALNDTGQTKDIYTADSPNLAGKVMFTSGTAGDPDAAFTRVDDSITDADKLAELVNAGYLIRTRTDSPGIHAPAGDTMLRDSAFASGAHFLSTDYYREDEALGTGYVVRFDDGAVARCNPVTAPPTCDPSWFVDER